jgi:Tol biopolymer transport system component
MNRQRLSTKRQLMKTNQIKSLLGAAVCALMLSTIGRDAQAQTTTARIAFQGLVTVKNKGPSASYQQIFSMNPEGTGVTQLTSGSISSFYPSWSPGQEYIAFMRNNTLCVMDAIGEANGGRSFAVTASRNFGLDWSPDGTKIVYTGTTPALGLTVVSVNPATGEAGTPSIIRAGEVYWPAWSPDGTRIAFCSSDDGGATQMITVMDVVTGAETSFGVGPTGSYNFTPSWKPDGSQIAFIGPTFFTTTSRGKQITSYYNEVFMANSDGGGILQVTNLKSDCIRPVWSPDGTALAFGNNGIQTLALDSGIMTLLRSSGSNPDWKP